MKSAEEIRKLMKTPEEVCEFLDDHFYYMTLYPAIEGFAKFFSIHKNMIPLIIDKMEKTDDQMDSRDKEDKYS
jgi:hypothetical protein